MAQTKYKIETDPSPAGASWGSDRTRPLVFVSHVDEDEEIAKALVACLEACLHVPSPGVRCTSLKGYRLRPGDPATGELREDLKACRVVLALITEQALTSGWVLMELGAAWALEKRTCPILAGVSFDRIPSPLQDTHAIPLNSAPDLAQLMQVVEEETGWKPKEAAKRQQAIQSLSEAGNMPVIQPATPLASSAALPPTSDPNVAALRVGDWVRGHPEAMKRLVVFSDLDRQLNLTGGLTQMVIDLMAEKEGWMIEIRSSEGILFRRMPLSLRR